MLNVISVQKGKSMGEIMFEINNTPIFRNFNKKERFCRYFVVFLLSFIVVSLSCFCIFRMFLPQQIYLPYLIYAILMDQLLPFVILCIVFTLLYCKMKKLHNYEFKKVKKSMIGFVCYELFLFCIVVFETIYADINGDSKEDEPVTAIFKMFILGFNVILQSVGIIVLKPSRDPLERISYLGYMQLVSIN